MAYAGIRTIVLDFSWSSFHRIIDVGGAYGSALAAIMQEHRSLQGILMDQPQVSPA